MKRTEGDRLRSGVVFVSPLEGKQESSTEALQLQPLFYMVFYFAALPGTSWFRSMLIARQQQQQQHHIATFYERF